MLYHASQTPGIQVLEPHVSNHNIPLIYLSSKRENTLPYCSNAVEKFCRETGYCPAGTWTKWASYGFENGLLCLEEYYPDAIEETYRGVSAYLYSVDDIPDAKPMEGIPFAFTLDRPVAIRDCICIPDACEAILFAAAEGSILLKRYENLTEAEHSWIHDTVLREYQDSESKEDYRYFLRHKFPFLASCKPD